MFHLMKKLHFLYHLQFLKLMSMIQFHYFHHVM